MPAAVDPIWKQRVWGNTATNPGMGPGPLRRLLVKEHGESAPSERWIASKQAEYRGENDEVKRLYLVARWPESFLDDSLPWEAASATWELQNHLQGRRPLIRLARWYWRLTLAIPVESRPPVGDRVNMAAELAASDAGIGRDGVERLIELYLRLAPWRSQEDHDRYIQDVPIELQYDPRAVIGPNLRGRASDVIERDVFRWIELTTGLISSAEKIEVVDEDGKRVSLFPESKEPKLEQRSSTNCESGGDDNDSKG